MFAYPATLRRTTAPRFETRKAASQAPRATAGEKVGSSGAARTPGDTMRPRAGPVRRSAGAALSTGEATREALHEGLRHGRGQRHRRLANAFGTCHDQPRHDQRTPPVLEPPADGHAHPGRMALAEVVAVRITLQRQAVEPRRPLRVHVGERGGSWFGTRRAAALAIHDVRRYRRPSRRWWRGCSPVARVA